MTLSQVGAPSSLQSTFPFLESFPSSGFGRRHICFRPEPYLFSTDATSVSGRKPLTEMVAATAEMISDMALCPRRTAIARLVKR